MTSRDNWVTCEEYTAGPYTSEQAAAKIAQVEKAAADDAPNACYLPHGIMVADVAPVPPWKQALEAGR